MTEDEKAADPEAVKRLLEKFPVPAVYDNVTEEDIADARAAGAVVMIVDNPLPGIKAETFGNPTNPTMEGVGRAHVSPESGIKEINARLEAIEAKIRRMLGPHYSHGLCTDVFDFGAMFRHTPFPDIGYDTELRLYGERFKCSKHTQMSECLRAVARKP